MKWPLPLFALTATLACSGPTQLEVGETEETVNSVIGESDFLLRPPKRVDIILVIDNSASMSDEQERLALELPRFVDTLEHALRQAHYRIAVVPTSGATCGAPVGEPITSSCRARPEDFIISPGREAPAEDTFNICESHCDLAAAHALPPPYRTRSIPEAAAMDPKRERRSLGAQLRRSAAGRPELPGARRCGRV